MATGGPVYRTTKETENYERVCRALVGLSTDVYRDVLRYYMFVEPSELWNEVNACPDLKNKLPEDEQMKINYSVHNSTISNMDLSFLYRLIRSISDQNLRHELDKCIQASNIWTKVQADRFLLSKLSRRQESNIKRASSIGSYSECDCLLLCTLLDSLCPGYHSKLVPTSNRWGGSPPKHSDIKLGDDIERIRILRNARYGNVSDTCMPDADFQNIWTELIDIMSRMDTELQTGGYYSTTLAELEKTNLDGKWEEYETKIKKLNKNVKRLHLELQKQHKDQERTTHHVTTLSFEHKELTEKQEDTAREVAALNQKQKDTADLEEKIEIQMTSLSTNIKGLIDKSESPEACAERELKEETGYTGVHKHTSPATCLDPGLGNTSVQFVTMEMARTKQTSKASAANSYPRATFGAGDGSSWGVKKKKKSSSKRKRDKYKYTSGWYADHFAETCFNPGNYKVGKPPSSLSFSRPSSSQSSYNRPSSSQIIDMTFLDDEMGHDSLDDEVLFGDLRGNIVGIRYYKGTVNNSEMVALERDPHNMYDRNAIKVKNVVGQQVGHIERELAAPLAQIMDQGWARLDGIVPFGSTNMYSMPVDLTLWGEPERKADAIAKLRSHEFFMKEAPDVQRGSGFESGAGPSFGLSIPTRRVFLSPAEVKNELDKLFENIQEGDKTSIAEPAKIDGDDPKNQHPSPCPVRNLLENITTAKQLCDESKELCEKNKKEHLIEKADKNLWQLESKEDRWDRSIEKAIHLEKELQGSWSYDAEPFTPDTLEKELQRIQPSKDFKYLQYLQDAQKYEHEHNIHRVIDDASKEIKLKKEEMEDTEIAALTSEFKHFKIQDKSPNKVQCSYCHNFYKGKTGLKIHLALSACGQKAKQEALASQEGNITTEGQYKEIESVCKYLEDNYKSYNPKLVPVKDIRTNEEHIKVLFLSEKVDKTSEENIHGQTVLFKNPKHFTEEVRNIPELSESDKIRAQNVLDCNLNELFEQHSNLVTASASSFKVDKDLEIVNGLHIVLFCVAKGFKPLHENKFPKVLSSATDNLPVDVREGYFSHCGYAFLSGKLYHDKVKMGCGIEIKEHRDINCGSIGPFLKLDNGQTGFLTCCHVTCENLDNEYEYDSTRNEQKLTVLQPPDNDDKTQNRHLGMVTRAVYSVNRGNGGSVDAAIVNITNSDRIPDQCGFAVCDQNNLSAARLNELPLYRGMYEENPNYTDEIVKFGTATHVTRGKLHLRNQTVRTGKIILYGLHSIEPKSGIAPFSCDGDSGAGVFQTQKKDGTEKSLSLIGILIGKLDGSPSDHKSYVCPVRPLFQKLNLEYDNLKCDSGMTDVSTLTGDCTGTGPVIDKKV